MWKEIRENTNTIQKANDDNYIKKTLIQNDIWNGWLLCAVHRSMGDVT